MSDTDHSTTHQAVSERLAWADKAEDAIRRVLDALGYHDAAKTKDRNSLVLSLLSWVGFLIAFKTDSHGIAASLWAGIAERVASASPTMAGSASDAWIAARADAMVNAFVQRFPPVHAIRPSVEVEAANDIIIMGREARAELAACVGKDPDTVGLVEIASECASEIRLLREDARRKLQAIRDHFRESQDWQEYDGLSYADAVGLMVRNLHDAREQARIALAAQNRAESERDALSEEHGRIVRLAEERRQWLAEMRAMIDVNDARPIVDMVRSLVVERDALRMAIEEHRVQADSVQLDDDAARAALAKVLDIEPDACSLLEMANRVADALAMGQRARTIAAESEAARLRAELHTAQRELATAREAKERAVLESESQLSKARETIADLSHRNQELGCARTAAHEYLNSLDVPRYPTLLSRIKDLALQRGTAQTEARELRTQFDDVKSKLGATLDDARIIRRLETSVSDVESLLNTNDVPRDKTLLERVHALIQQRDAARATAAVSLPKPDRIEPGQRWAFTVAELDEDEDARPAIDDFVCSGWVDRKWLLHSDAWRYMGMTPSAEG